PRVAASCWTRRSNPSASRSRPRREWTRMPPRVTRAPGSMTAAPHAAAGGDQGPGLEDGVAGPGRAGCGTPGHLQPSLVVAGVEPGLGALEQRPRGGIEPNQRRIGGRSRAVQRTPDRRRSGFPQLLPGQGGHVTDPRLGGGAVAPGHVDLDRYPLNATQGAFLQMLAGPPEDIERWAAAAERGLA